MTIHSIHRRSTAAAPSKSPTSLISSHFKMVREIKALNSLRSGALGIMALCSYMMFLTIQPDTAIVDLAKIQTKPSMFTVSYVTSFWAKKLNDTASNPHRREVEAALMANIHNPYFDQIVVFLDGVSEQSNCVHFLGDMRDIDVNLGLNVLEQDDSIAKVTCIDVEGSQPPYYSMFMNSLSDVVLGDVVVMANADQAFDYSIALAHTINPDVLAVLGTRGYSENMPQFTKYFYRTLVGDEYLSNTGKDIIGGTVGVNICSSSPYSWDTYIFHKNALKGKLKEKDFLRPNKNNEMVHFYMNEMGAENAALWALQQTSFTSLYNACDVIHSWHFHLTPKTHKEHESPWKKVGNGPFGSVPYPWGGYEQTTCTGRKKKRCRPGHPIPSKTPKCVADKNCFLDENEVERELSLRR